MKIIIGGALGRMGRELALAAEAEGTQVICGVDVAYQGQPFAFRVVTGYEHILDGADVMIDFSRPDGLPELLAFCQEKHMPCVLCATGYTEVELRSIEASSAQIPILRSANMSLGVHVLEQLVAMASKALGESFDIEITEKHHRMKLDSPSGTALMLYEAAKKELDIAPQPVYGRHGRNEKRGKGDIGLHAVRGGTVTGEHEIGFYGDGEQILITHRAESRALFARGALRGARFLVGKPAQLYSMRDVVLEMLGED